MTEKHIQDEARTEAAAAELLAANSQAGVGGTGIVDSAQQAILTVPPATLNDVVVGPLGPHTPLPGGRPVKFSGYTAGIGGIGLIDLILRIQTSIDAGATWQTQSETHASGIPSGGIITGSESLSGYQETVTRLLTAVPTLARLTVTTVGAPGTATYTTTAVIDGELTWQQF